MIPAHSLHTACLRATSGPAVRMHIYKLSTGERHPSAPGGSFVFEGQLLDFRLFGPRPIVRDDVVSDANGVGISPIRVYDWTTSQVLLVGNLSLVCHITYWLDD
jgi:hypothetical protein